VLRKRWDGNREDIDMLQLSRIKVRIAHSDPLIAAGLAATLKKQPDFVVVGSRPDSAVAPSQGHAVSRDVVIADYDSGLRLATSRSGRRDRVVILTHSDSEATICHALEQGARGYLLLGCSLRELLEGLRSVHAGHIALGPLVASRIAERMKQQALTRRETDILRLMMLGLCNKRIALELAMAVGTAKTHVKSILRKLDAASRTEAVAIAQRRGILAGEREGLHPPFSGARLEPTVAEIDTLSAAVQANGARTRIGVNGALPGLSTGCRAMS
jgi:DNA-binding NarL/FixJ family response regulator